jgi:hypothetical protein
MTDQEHRVAIVVDPAYGSRLDPLSQRLHVWVADTPANRAAAENLWRSRPEVSLDRGVTTFRVADGEPPARSALAILSAVIDHHGEYSHSPPVSVIEFHGCSPTPELIAELADLGFPTIAVGSEAWRASARPAV